MPRLSFFVGKGGVGKTTVSAAYAAAAALESPRRRVLLVSTDPAHSLADVFNQELGNAPCTIRLSAPGRLHAWQIDAQDEFARFLGENRHAILRVVESGTIFSRREIEPLLDTTVPGMAEISALMTIHDLLASREYEEIVVDTAPVGHTLRLFEMPEHFARLLDFLDVAASRDRILAEHFGGTGTRIASQPFLAQWRRMVEGVQQALGGEDARITLISTPESFALNQSVRAAQALQATAKLRVGALVLNRAVVRGEDCPVCCNRARQTRAARSFLRQHFPQIPLRIAEDQGGPVIGAASLRIFAEHVFEGRRRNVDLKPPRVADIQFRRVAWPVLKTPLSLTVGKGGVGKTTISAALAYQFRKSYSKRSVTICSTDPAPSLDDIFRQQIGDEPAAVLGDRRLCAIELDAVSQFRRWSERMKRNLEQAMTSEVHGVHVDLSFDRQVISALLNVVPPGVDEIFAIFRILDLVGGGRDALVVDMAPTGHALELLRMPARMRLWARLLLKSLAAHRTLPLAQDVAVEIASVGQRVRELVDMLRDGRRSRVWPVMLAEPLPDRETGRLLAGLREIGTHCEPLFVNRVIFPADAGRCGRCHRAHLWQMATLGALQGRTAKGRILCARDFGQEITGKRGLQRFTSELWQIE